MSNEQHELLTQHLEQYPGVSLTPEQVAEALGVTRRHVDTLLNDGIIESFVINPESTRKQKRVTKAALIAYIIKNQTKQ